MHGCALWKLKLLQYCLFDVLADRDNTVQNFRVTSRLTNLVRLSWSPPKKSEVNIYLVSVVSLNTIPQHKMYLGTVLLHPRSVVGTGSPTVNVIFTCNTANHCSLLSIIAC